MEYTSDSTEAEAQADQLDIIDSENTGSENIIQESSSHAKTNSTEQSDLNNTEQEIVSEETAEKNETFLRIVSEDENDNSVDSILDTLTEGPVTPFFDLQDNESQDHSTALNQALMQDGNVGLASDSFLRQSSTALRTSLSEGRSDSIDTLSSTELDTGEYIRANIHEANIDLHDLFATPDFTESDTDFVQPDYYFREINFIGIEQHALPSDPGLTNGNFWNSWHLTGANGLNVQSVWEEYTGNGVSVAVFDDGVNRTHSELSNNYDTNRDRDTLDDDNDAISTSTSDSHGTHVSMMIAADDNGAQSVGVAFDSTIVGIRRGFGSQTSGQDTLEGFQHALSEDVDIMNNSWGTSTAFGDHKDLNFVGVDPGTVISYMETMAQTGRSGLGTNIVFSAGNSNEDGMSANYKNYQNSPFTITVGAASSDGTIADFSEWGSNVLLSAPGDDVRVSYTTDGSAVTIDGTSFSAPAVAGVIALMLEANPDLGYRDVQEILAMSSRQTDISDPGWFANGSNEWNGGGMTFNHDFGYGIADAHAAVRLAESWHQQQTYSNMTETAQFDGGTLSIPSTGTVTTTINVTEDIEIEHILIDLDIDHSRAGDLIVTLISPDGTESILVDRIANGTFTTMFGIKDGFFFEFSSVAHWGETSAGTWTLEIQDVVGGNSGTLNDWDLQFIGHDISADDTYVYTEDFSLFADDLGSRANLSDSNGGTDTLNASAITSSSTIDLADGTATLDGVDITISGIEDIYTGDGDDIITGDSGDNHIWGGRGADTINGGTGDDTAEWLHDIDSYTFDLNGAVISVTRDSVADLVSSIETFIFDGVSYLRSEILDIIFGEQGNSAPTVTATDADLGEAESILASSIITANDPDGHALSYIINDSNSDANSAYFELNGVQLAAGQDHTLSQAEFDLLRIIGGTENSIDSLSIQVTDGGLTASDDFTVTTTVINLPPSITASSTIIESDASILASDVFSASDDGTLTYQIFDHNGTSNSAFFLLNGVGLAANTIHNLTAEQFANLRIVGADFDFNEQFSVKASDGELVTSWTSASIISFDDDTPTVNTSNVSLPSGISVLASHSINVSDTDTDVTALTYTINDGNSNSNSAYMVLDGVALAAGQDHELTYQEFARLRFHSGSATGDDVFTVTVSDASTTSEAETVTLSTSGRPVVTVQDSTMNAGDDVSASSLITATDGDGDDLTYMILDSNAGANSGYFELDGVELSAGTIHTLTQAEFDTLRIVAGDAQGIDFLSVNVTDGSNPSGWQNFTVLTNVDLAPEVTANDLTLLADRETSVWDHVSISDPDTNNLTYTVRDNTSGNSTGYFELDGVALAANQDHQLTESEFFRLILVGGTVTGTDSLSVTASDGTTSVTDTFTLTTDAGNTAPTITMPNRLTLQVDATILASDAVTIADPEGDTLTYFVFDTNGGASSAYLSLDGVTLAARQNHELTQAEFERLEIIGGDGNGSNNILFRTSDGEFVTRWETLSVQTTNNSEINGTGGDDVMAGDDNDNVIAGNGGDDVLFGYGGADTLYGGDGADIFGFAPEDSGSGGPSGSSGVGGVSSGSSINSGEEIGSSGDTGAGFSSGGVGSSSGGSVGSASSTSSGGNKVPGGSVSSGEPVEGEVGGSTPQVPVGADTIGDFSLADGDRLDISQMLTDFDPTQDAITDFVRITSNGGNSYLAVDSDGGANDFEIIATIENVTGLTDEQDLLDNGTLIV